MKTHVNVVVFPAGRIGNVILFLSRNISLVKQGTLWCHLRNNGRSERPEHEHYWCEDIQTYRQNKSPVPLQWAWTVSVSSVSVSAGNWGSRAVIHVICVAPRPLTFGPHVSAAFVSSAESQWNRNRGFNKAHVFKHTHWNGLMKSHSHVRLELTHK